MSSEEFVSRADAVIEEWTTMRDADVSKDAVRYMPDVVAPTGARGDAASVLLRDLNQIRQPGGYGWRQGFNPGGIVRPPLVAERPYPLVDVEARFGLRQREPLVIRVASFPGRVLEAIWLWHWNQMRRSAAKR